MNCYTDKQNPSLYRIAHLSAPCPSHKITLKCRRDNLAMLLFCVYFDLVTDWIYRTVQLMQHKGMNEMY